MKPLGSILLSVLLILALASCASGPKSLIGVGHSELGLASSSGATIQDLFIATTRRRSENSTEFFSGERSEIMGLGNVSVSIPPAHKTGQIEQPSAGQSDVRKHFIIGRPHIFDNSADFQNRINNALAKRPKGQKNLLLFVHGYNTNFSAAVLRMAQFVHDTGFKGVPILFTWASRGKTIDYVYDINSSLQARLYLVALTKILKGTNAEGVDVVAHSMGNLVTLEAMTALGLQGDTGEASRIRHIILAAPDIDFDLFVEQLRNLGSLRSRVFILVSGDDKALSISRTLAGGVSRVGDADPKRLAALGLNVVDISKVRGSDSANHTKFANSPALVGLIGRGIRDGNTLSTGAQSLPTRELIGSAFKSVVSIPSAIAGERSGTVLELENQGR